MLVRTLPVAPRPGLTLLEVIVSLAIFLLSLVAISRLIELGTSTANRANHQSECLRLAQCKMSELVAGKFPLDGATTDGAAFADDQEYSDSSVAGYKYTINCTTDPDFDSGLWDVTVTVYFELPGGDKVSVTLGHMIFDPTARGTNANPTTSGSGGGS
jgi:prepilin-type N-terminal cleavage/methylation domain-containing protein